MTATANLRRDWQPRSPAALRRARGKLHRASAQLASEHGTPDLGNVRDPLDEAVFILLTLQTDIPRARSVWRSLRTRFPSWVDVAGANEEELAQLLRPAGLQRQRARGLKRLLEAVGAPGKGLSLSWLASLSDEDAERALVALPGFDVKTARCILMYSLDRETFPVDSNAFLFFVRYGVIRRDARYRRRRLHDELQALVPPSDRRSLHVNLVAHGQKHCRPLAPACGSCPLRRACAFRRGKT